jgi:DNA-binding NtrC family response regulator
VRVVAATNRDLHRAVEAKEFRADLFYRLRVIVVRLPSLRERREDIFALAQHFIDEFNPVLGKSIIGLTPEASERLATADWPGNVRELKHVMEQAVLLCERDHIGMEELDPGVADSGSSTFRLPPQGLVLENLERSLVQQALDVTGWNRVRAAKLLGLNRDQIRYRIEKFGLCRRPD